MATLKELAAYTKLSVTTISRILNNDPTMVASEETRRRVFDAAGALGYKKHSKTKVASAMRLGLAEMLTPAEQLEDPFYLYLKNFAAQECMERRIDMVPLTRQSAFLPGNSSKRCTSYPRISYFWTPHRMKRAAIRS